VAKGSATTGGAELAVKIMLCGKECSRTAEDENTMYKAAHAKEYSTVISQKERVWIDKVESEARAMLELQQSPHVLGAYAAGWYQSRHSAQSVFTSLRSGVGAYGIAMELANEDLQKFIYRTTLSETQVALFVAGLFFGLRDIHEP